MVRMNRTSGYPAILVFPERCNGRLRCVKVCPVKAIRLKKGVPEIKWSLCINCGECIKACHSQAIQPFLDTFLNLEQFKYRIAIPSPVLYSHFGMSVSPSMIFSALKALGFDEVFDISGVCGAFMWAIKKLLEEKKVKRPLISSTCPVVVKLIQVKYPSLIPHLVPLLPPRHFASAVVEARIKREKRFKREDIGIIYITPCASKFGEIRSSNQWSSIDGVIGIQHLYNQIATFLQEHRSGKNEVEICPCGARWVTIGGAGEILSNSEVVVSTGIHNVMRVFDDIETGALRNLSFVECFACEGGCIGGPLVVENSYLTRQKILVKFEECSDKPCEEAKEYVGKYLKTVKKAEEIWGGMPEEEDRVIEKRVKVLMGKEEILQKLPEVDCALCGAPSCETFAEDVAIGEAELTECIFYRIRARLNQVEDELNVGKFRKKGGIH